MIEFFESLLNQDAAPIVICDLNHKIIYMNESAVRRYGKLLGKSILDCHNEESCMLIKKVVEWFLKSEDNNKIYTSRNEKENKDVYMIALRNTNRKLIGYYEKHEYRGYETEKQYDF